MSSSNDSSDNFAWRDVERFFIHLLVKSEYDQHSAEQLGFCIRQVLEDAKPLIDALKDGTDLSSHDSEEMLEQIHMLLNNHHLFSDGYRILMREPGAEILEH